MISRSLLLLLTAALLWRLCSAQTGASLNDRIVGYWRSSSGAEVTVSYSGQPDSFWIQTGDRQYTAFWLSEISFRYQADGVRVLGEYHPATDSVTLWNEERTWQARWTRR